MASLVTSAVNPYDPDFTQNSQPFEMTYNFQPNVINLAAQSELKELILALLLHIVGDGCQDDAAIAAVDDVIKSGILLPRLPYNGDISQIILRIEELKSMSLPNSKDLEIQRLKEQIAIFEKQQMKITVSDRTYADFNDTYATFNGTPS